jgi:hypothetical protein
MWIPARASIEARACPSSETDEIRRLRRMMAECAANCGGRAKHDRDDVSNEQPRSMLPFCTALAQTASSSWLASSIALPAVAAAGAASLGHG